MLKDTENPGKTQQRKLGGIASKCLIVMTRLSAFKKILSRLIFFLSKDNEHSIESINLFLFCPVSFVISKVVGTVKRKNLEVWKAPKSGQRPVWILALD